MGQLGYIEGNYHKKVYPLLWNLIDSHDFSRFLYRCKENVDRFKLGVGLQLVWPGMPFIYYGDEYGMTGGADPDCRRGMVWDEAYQNKEVYQWYKKLIQIRKEYPALTEGKTVEIFADDTYSIFAITKELDRKQITLLVNGSANEVSEKEIGNLKKYIMQKNIVTNDNFSGKLSAFELAVLTNL